MEVCYTDVGVDVFETGYRGYLMEGEEQQQQEILGIDEPMGRR